MLANIRSIAAVWVISAISLAAGSINLETATILDLQKAYDEGLTAEKVVEVYLKRIEAYDRAGPKLNSILAVNPNALEIARQLDAERKEKGPRSIMHGVPVLVKDNYDTFDMPTTGGSKALAGSTPRYDAFTVRKLREAGAIIFAKTNLDEFARGATGTSSLGGQVLNPYNLSKIPGGSSGGSGVGVAALFGWVGLGTETGSSIRNPSTKANLVGFSPSEGLVSRQGIIPISITYDRAGPMTRSVTDAAITMSIMAGTDAGDLFTYKSLGHAPTDNYLTALKSDGLKGARIGVLRDLFGTDPQDQPAVDLVNAAIAKLKEQGAFILDPVEAGVDLHAVMRETNTGSGEYKAALNNYLAARGGDLKVNNLTELIASGGYLGRLKPRYTQDDLVGEMSYNTDYIGRYKGKYAVQKAIHELMDRWSLDVLVYPHETKPVRTIEEAVPGGGEVPAPISDPARGNGNRISTVTGMPTITVPAGFNTDGVSVGIEFLGRLYDEATVIRLAYAYEQAAPNRKLPPTTPLLGIETIDY